VGLAEKNGYHPWRGCCTAEGIEDASTFSRVDGSLYYTLAVIGVMSVIQSRYISS